jgi:large subunit ribosomal protein L30
MSEIRVRQVRSVIGVTPKHRGTLRALGLGRIGKVNVLPDRPEIRGMLAKVPHLVSVVESESDRSAEEAVAGATPTRAEAAEKRATKKAAAGKAEPKKAAAKKAAAKKAAPKKAAPKKAAAKKAAAKKATKTKTATKKKKTATKRAP